MSFTDVKIKIPDRNWDQVMGDITHLKRGLRFEKSQRVEFLPRKKKVDFRLLDEALRRVSRVVVVVVVVVGHMEKSA